MPIQPNQKHRIWKSHSYASLEVSATVCLRNLLFWDMTLHQWVIGSKRYDGTLRSSHPLMTITSQKRRILIMFLFHLWNIHWISIKFCIDGIHSDCPINFILICTSSDPPPLHDTQIYVITHKKWFTKNIIGITYFVDFVHCTVLKITYFQDRICPSYQAKNKANTNLVRTHTYNSGSRPHSGPICRNHNLRIIPTEETNEHRFPIYDPFSKH